MVTALAMLGGARNLTKVVRIVFAPVDSAILGAVSNLTKVVQSVFVLNNSSILGAVNNLNKITRRRRLGKTAVGASL